MYWERKFLNKYNRIILNMFGTFNFLIIESLKNDWDTLWFLKEHKSFHKSGHTNLSSNTSKHTQVSYLKRSIWFQYHLNSVRTDILPVEQKTARPWVNLVCTFKTELKLCMPCNFIYSIISSYEIVYWTTVHYMII